MLVDTGDGLVYPIKHLRLEYDKGEALPCLPESLEQIKSAVEAVARDNDTTPQSIHPSQVSFEA